MKDLITKLISLSVKIKVVIATCCLLVVAVPVAAVIIQNSYEQPLIIETTTKKEETKTTIKEEKTTSDLENSTLVETNFESDVYVTKNIADNGIALTQSTTKKQQTTNNKTNTTTTKQIISDDVKKYYPYGVDGLTYLGTKNGRVFYAGRKGYSREFNCVHCGFCFYDYDEITDWYCYTCYWNGLGKQQNEDNVYLKELFIQKFGVTKETIGNEYKELCQEYGEKYALQLIGEKYPGRTGYDGEIIAENYTNDYFTLNEKGLFLAKTPFYSISQADYRVRNSTDCFGCGAHVDRGDNYHCPWCGQLQEELETMEGVWENEIVGMW